MTNSDTLNQAKILVVDDVPENLHIVVESLKNFYKIAIARSGEKALQLVNTAPPDLILLDIMMPNMGGYEVCHTLKADPKTSNIPIIFLTALTDEASELQGFAEGAADYIRKPISIPVVQARVRTHLDLVFARRRLTKQVKMLEDAAKLRDDVDRIMRHDLKGPLTPLLAYSDLMLMDKSITPSLKDLAKEIRTSGYNMLNMINSSLDLYKMETNRYQLQPQSIDLQANIARVLDSLNVLAKRSQVQIKTQLQQIMIMGEEMLCISLFTNLIKNAIEATAPNGTVSISIEKAANLAKISIANPTPVPEAIRATFFHKYTTSGKKTGTGLGTYSAKLMAHTMKGDIILQTNAEVGTCVIVSLPTN